MAKLKEHSTAILAVAVVALGIWVSVIDGKLDKQKEHAEWLERRVLAASDQIKVLEAIIGDGAK